MLSLFKRWYQRHFSQPGTIEFALVLITSFLIIYYLMWLVGPLVVALCIAFCLDWPVEVFQRIFKIGRKLSSIIVMLLFCTISISIFLIVVPQVIKQGTEFYNSFVSFSAEAYDPGKQQNSAFDQSNQHNNVIDLGTSITAPATTPYNNQLAHNKAIDKHLDNNDAQKAFEQEQKSNELKQSDDIIKNRVQQAALQAYSQAQDKGNEQANATAAAAAAAISEAASIVHEQNREYDKNQDNASISLFDFNHNNDFKLTTNDFDILVARELTDFVERLPAPIPSIITTSYLEQGVRSMRVQATNKIASLMRDQLMPSVVNAFTWLVYIIIVPIFTFLMLYNKADLQRRARIFILPNDQGLMNAFWPSLHNQIAGYIRGKIIHIIIIAIANTLAFKLLGVNYALLLGVGVGLSVVIPYVGAVIIAVPVVFVSIFQFGFSESLIWVLVIYTIIQLLDSNVLTPMLFSKAMNLDAFSILAAILIFGGLWGFWGVFFAIPLATLIKTLILGWPNLDEPLNSVQLNMSNIKHKPHHEDKPSHKQLPKI